MEAEGRDVKVFRYRHVVPDSIRQSREAIPATEFRRQLELLDRWGYTTVTLRDIKLAMAGELLLPKKPVVLTFDRGYREVYDVAFPLLEEFESTAVVFAAADRTIRRAALDREPGLPLSPLLDDRQILEMHTAGIEIGAHGMTSARLARLVPAAAWDEINGSRLELENLLGTPIISFAYPYQEVNLLLKRLVAEAGFVFACGGPTGAPVFGSDLYDIRRIEIRRDTGLLGFGLRVLNVYEHYETIKKKSLSSLSRAGRKPLSIEPEGNGA